MATIQDAIRAYWLHRSMGMLNELNNIFKMHHHPTAINQTIAKHLFEGAHQAKMPYQTKYHYAKTFTAMSKALCSSSLMTNKYADVDDLYSDVKKLLYPISGIGLLTVYDVALRIGFVRKEQILPQQKVYLSRGALYGANNLRNTMPKLFNKIPTHQLNRKGELTEGAYNITIFDPILQAMTSPFLEDFFCVYDSKLKKLSSLTYKQLQ